MCIRDRDEIPKVAPPTERAVIHDSKSAAGAEVSSGSLLDQEQGPTSIDEISIQTSLISYSHTLPMFSSPNTKVFSSACQKLSPIASSSSISAIGTTCNDKNSPEFLLSKASPEPTKYENDIFKAAVLEETDVKESHKQKTSDDDKLAPSKTVLHQEASGIYLKEAAIHQTLSSVPFKRSGQRAFSESEAQNFSHNAGHAGIIGNIPAPYWAGNRSTCSESCYPTTRNLTMMRVPKISLILGSQLGAMSSTYGSAQAPLSRLGTSATSVSSTGSWTENPGFHTLRSLRKRPQLVDNETLTTVAGMSHTFSVVQQNTPNQRTSMGLFGTAGEGVSGSSSSRGVGCSGLPKSSDSMSKRFRSHDYRFHRLKHRLKVFCLGGCVRGSSRQSADELGM